MTIQRTTSARGVRAAVVIRTVFIGRSGASVHIHAPTSRHCLVDSAFLFARVGADAPESDIDHLQAVQV